MTTPLFLEDACLRQVAGVVSEVSEVGIVLDAALVANPGLLKSL